MITRFAGAAPHRERHETLRALGPIRTADLQVRNLMRYPLRYEGMVQAAGLDPTGLLLYRQRLTPYEHLHG